MRLIEVLAFALAVGIIANEILRTQSLTFEELMAAVFFFGMAAASIADRTGQRGPVDFVRDVMDALRGGGRGGGP